MIPGRGVLKNVMVVPEVKHNLQSVSQLTRKFKCSVHFFPEFCVFQDLFIGEVKGISNELEGLYYYPRFSAQTKEIDTTTANNKCLVTKTNSQSLRWHYTMGHPLFRVLKKLYKDVNQDVCENCPICPLAKQTKLPFPMSVSRTNDIFDLIHLDVWGPYKTVTHSDFRFFLTIVDDNSRMFWLFLLKFKSDVLITLKSFFSLVQTQFSKQVKRVRSDDGTEFFNRECNELFHLWELSMRVVVHILQNNMELWRETIDTYLRWLELLGFRN